MGSRMDKYKDNSDIPTRSDKNKELYKQIYNAYDEFENLVVPSNVKEIDLASLKKEIVSRDDYKKLKEISDFTNNHIVRKESISEEQKKENEIYDINELLNKAVQDKNSEEIFEPMMSSDSYLKKLKLDTGRTNLDDVKDIYEDIRRETEEENETLLKTANLSLEILSDLKGDNDNTLVEAPIKEEFLEDTQTFYSSEYMFSKNDFDAEGVRDEELVTSEEMFDDNDKPSRGKLLLKILLLLLGIGIVVVIGLLLFSYFKGA